MQFFFCGDGYKRNGKEGKKMKKVMALLMTLVLFFSASFGAIAASDHPGNGNGSRESTAQKSFKVELNEQKKRGLRPESGLQAQKEALEAQYEELLASGDTAGAEALLADINDLSAQIAALQAEMKQIINERHMVVKTMYSDEELRQFDSAADLIGRMYADAYVLEAGSVIVKNNLIKFDMPPYIKGRRTLVPVRAVSEELGAQVAWNEDTRSVTISKDDIVVVMSVNSCVVYVDGVETQMDVPAEATCGPYLCAPAVPGGTFRPGGQLGRGGRYD
jgi:hypothetical protein